MSEQRETVIACVTAIGLAEIDHQDAESNSLAIRLCKELLAELAQDIVDLHHACEGLHTLHQATGVALMKVSAAMGVYDLQDRVIEEIKELLQQD